MAIRAATTFLGRQHPLQNLRRLAEGGSCAGYFDKEAAFARARRLPAATGQTRGRAGCSDFDRA